MGEPNLAHRLCDEQVARGRGAVAAVVEPKRSWTYAELAEQSARAGNVLRELGVKPGDRVALRLHDSAELASTFIGAVRIGAVPVPLSVLWRPLELRALLLDAGVVAAVSNPDLAADLEDVRAEVPTLQRIVIVGNPQPGQEDFLKLARDVPAECPAFEAPTGAPAFLLYSARAGGAPKGVAHGHGAAAQIYDAYAQKVLRMVPDDRMFTTSSLASAFGLGMGLLLPLLGGATTFLLPTRPKPSVVLDTIESFRPTIFAGFPSMYGMLVHDYREEESEGKSRPGIFSSVRLAVSGAEGLPAALERRIHQTFGVQMLHGFGVTEALHFVLSNRPGAQREGSAGRPLDGVEARLVDDTGRPVGVHEMGSLEVRGPTVASGYWNRAPEQGEFPAFHDGWVRPGDRFFRDGDGYYFHCGRQDDLFKVSGRWVAPGEVERTLLGHPSVWECAVVEGHDEDGLARPVAFVVPNVGHEPTDQLAKDLMEYVKKEIAPWKYPREIAFVTELPKGANGQVLRWRLRRP
jgi:benzoate-CoA ligase family protein